MQNKKSSVPLSPGQQRQKQLSLAQSHAHLSSSPFPNTNAYQKLQDYWMQLMLLEQQNRKRLLIFQNEQLAIAREEQRLATLAMKQQARRKQILRTAGAKL